MSSTNDEICTVNDVCKLVVNDITQTVKVEDIKDNEQIDEHIDANKSIVNKVANETNENQNEIKVNKSVDTASTNEPGKYITQHIALCDSDTVNNLRLYHFVDNNKSANEQGENQLTDEYKNAQNCRGIIRHDDDIVCKTYGFTPEISIDNTTLFEYVNADNFKEYKYCTSYEGCLMRLFCFNNKWYLSTHRKINAFDSKWSHTKSFGKLFLEALYKFQNNKTEASEAESDLNESFDTFCSSLDPNIIYCVLLKNDNTNRIVCISNSNSNSNSQANTENKDQDQDQNPTQDILFAGAFCQKTFKYINENNTSLPSAESHDFSNFDDLTACVLKMDPFICQGIIANKIEDDDSVSQIKILNPNYEQLFKLRDNEPNLLTRYLQLRTSSSLPQFCWLYSDQTFQFQLLENRINQLYIDLFKLYKQRYILKQQFVLPPSMHWCLKQFHKWHNLNRDHNKISMSVVKQIVDLQEVKLIQQMLNN